MAAFREFEDVHPEGAGFTCVGTTRRGLRCRQSFIARSDLQEASRVLDSLLDHQHLHTNPTALLPTLKRLAGLTLCPRWHRYDRPGERSQANAVAARWLRDIQDLNSSQTGRNSQNQQPGLSTRRHPGRLHSLPPPSAPPSPTTQGAVRSHQATTQRTAERLPQLEASPAHTHTSTHVRSNTASENESSTTSAARPSPSQAVSSNAASTPRTAISYQVHTTSSQPITIQTSASTPQRSSNGSNRNRNEPCAVEISFNITISPDTQHPNSTTITQAFPNDLPSINTTISIFPTPDPANGLSAANSRYAKSGSLQSSPSSSRAVSRSSRGSTRNYVLHSGLSSQISRSSRSRNLSTESHSSFPPPSGPAELFFSPPRSPLAPPPPGSLSISSDISPSPTINTPSSSGTSSPFLLSPPQSPGLPPSPSPSPSPPESVSSESSRNSTQYAERRALPEMCPICYEFITGPSEAVWCRSTCGQNICNGCFEEWNEQQRSSIHPLRCMYWYDCLLSCLVELLLMVCTVENHGYFELLVYLTVLVIFHVIWARLSFVFLERLEVSN
jgi:hypothetical protein